MVTKAVIAVAGLGSRLLPLTKTLPKELLPLGLRPVIDYVVEELYQGGVHHLLLVTSQRKRPLEDYFDRDPALEQNLTHAGKTSLIPSLQPYPDLSFYLVRQRAALGNGDAVRYAEAFAGSQPFFVAWGDSIIWGPGRKHLLQTMIEVHQAEGTVCTIAVEEVPRQAVQKYGIIKPAGEATGDLVEVADLVEKPAPEQAPGNLAIAARYLFSADIFDALRAIQPGLGGEIWLADAIRYLLRQGQRVRAVKLSPQQRRYDIGTPRSYLQSFIDLAIQDPEHGRWIRDYLRKIIANCKF